MNGVAVGEKARAPFFGVVEPNKKSYAQNRVPTRKKNMKRERGFGADRDRAVGERGTGGGPTGKTKREKKGAPLPSSLAAGVSVEIGVMVVFVVVVLWLLFFGVLWGGFWRSVWSEEEGGPCRFFVVAGEKRGKGGEREKGGWVG